MAIKPWEMGVVAAFVGGYCYLMWRARQAARPDRVLGEVKDVRRHGAWALQAVRILVLKHDSHGTRSVRLQFLSPGTTLVARLMPEEAIRVAALLRRAAAQDGAMDGAEPTRQTGALGGTP